MTGATNSPVEGNRKEGAHTHVRRVIAASLTPPLLLAAGCAAEAEKSDSSVNPSAEPTNGSPGASESPKAETAQAFIRRWQSEEDEMQRTGVTKSYLALAQGCRPCNEFAAIVTDYYSAGGWIRTRGADVRSVKFRGSAGRFDEYRLSLTIHPTRYRETGSSKVKHYGGGISDFIVTIKKVGDTFKVIDYAEIPR